MGEENKKKKKRIVMIIVAALLVVAAIILFFVFRSRISATTMRILRLEGTVSLEESGKSKTVKENLRLKSGDALSTAVKSLVSIGLDDTKIVTLNENSRAEFNQSGRELDLSLTAGSLYFDVSEPLTEEESFDIRTSTMVVGIRGTSGLVSVEGTNESLIVTDGTVHVIGTNPFTKEVKEIDVKAGQRITVYLYNDRDIDSIEFVLEEVTEHELPEFVLQYLRDNLELLDKVVKETGWDRDWILGIKKDVPEPAPEESEPSSGDDTTAVEPAPTPEPEPEVTAEEAGPAEEEEEPVDKKKESRERGRRAIADTDPTTGIVTLTDGTLFDPGYYAESNPDVVEEYGTDTDALIGHYLDFGRGEGRPPIRPAVVVATTTPTPTPSSDPGNGGSGESSEPAEEEEEQAAGDEEEYASTGEWEPGMDVRIGNRLIGNISGGKLAITSDGSNVSLPMKLTDSNGNTTRVISRLSDVNLAASGNANSFSVTDTTTGARIRVNQSAGVYKATAPDGTVITGTSLSNLQHNIGEAGL
ncbi:MAG: FecR family protein [Lachnospiraceae bacterium]|nr:FecR family protein [Lachnospiraceae bacterium]